MGAVTFSIDKKLIEQLQPYIPFDVFIETGTFRGETIDIVKPYFKTIYSIELSSHYYAEAQQKFAADDHVTLFHGESPSILHTVIPQLQNRSVIYWLDAHWCVADATAGELSQCPLLNELATIQSLNTNSMIIIDDARLFLSTPQAPHEISCWPSFDSIVKSLCKLSDEHQIAVINDCILFFHSSIENVIKQFSYDHGIDWLDMLNRCRDSEALLIKVCKENEMLHNLSIRKRIRGIFGHAKRRIAAKLAPIF